VSESRINETLGSLYNNGEAGCPSRLRKARHWNKLAAVEHGNDKAKRDLSQWIQHIRRQSCSQRNTTAMERAPLADNGNKTAA
jgi:hypothetical protein